MVRPLSLVTIGHIRTPFVRAAGTPIQPRGAEGCNGTVEVLPEYAEGLKDVDGFDRIWLIYWLDRAAPAGLQVRPYMDTVQRGIFSTRSPSRPNPIGMSCVKLLSVDGCTLHVGNVDILDNTPLLDIKPYAPDFDIYPTQRIGWMAGRTAAGKVADDRFHQRGNTNSSHL